ncbi:MAG: SH3 domain-containing protein [Caldilineaceae bacterium]|nr:SH3 domain-containing protein [Caldilineaceae bacterium]MBP8122823.1 SH3 domain-containing protein [Caldilineaceae bacterium]MBP9073769.1 SH3 domain-containing protein [Caldilineaceae bacterium]
MEIRLSHALMGLGALIALALFGFLASSVIAPTQPPMPTATVTLPTPTPSPTWTPRPTAIPSPTPTPPVQALPQPIRSNLRSGPGLDFNVVATIAGDTPVEVIARSPDDDWLLVRAPGAPSLAWLSASLVDPATDLAAVPRLSEADLASVVGQ